MKSIDPNQEFIKILESKFSKKTQLANFIADTLFVEKETAYRRLRGEVQFSLREAIRISRKLNISLDNIILEPESRDTVLLQLPLFLQNNDKKLENAIFFLKELVSQPYSELGGALSGLPFSLFLQYPLLARYYNFRYLYHISEYKKKVSFQNTFESKEQIDARDDLYLLYRKISKTFYIWDRKIISTLVNDINYFNYIQLISNSEMESLKKELFRFINDLENLASAGEYKETGNIFELYISELDIDKNYVYMWSEHLYVNMFSTFILFASASQDEPTYAHINLWINSFKKCSTLISKSGIKERILFFNEQRRIIDTLGQ